MSYKWAGLSECARISFVQSDSLRPFRVLKLGIENFFNVCYNKVYANFESGGDAVRILGIDPGYAIVGFGVIDYAGSHFRAVEYGSIYTEAHTPFTERLMLIDTDMQEIIRRYKPDCMAIERLYFTTNRTTAIDVAQARGILILEAAKAGLDIHEYTPLQVKQAVVGYGKAEKHQVMDMTRRILRLEQIPRPDDAADALAIAICHAHCCKGMH